MSKLSKRANYSLKEVVRFMPHYIMGTVCLTVALTATNILSDLAFRSIHAPVAQPQQQQQQPQEQAKATNGKLPSQYKIGKPYRKAIKDKSKPLIVEFFADWCPHCERITPIYEKVSKKVKGANFASVNAEDPANSDLTQHYKVDKYPFFVIVNTKTGEYEEFGLTQDSFTPEGMKRQFEELLDKYNPYRN